MSQPNSSPDMSSHEMFIKPCALPQAISPFIMPPPEYNTMIPQGLTAQQARSQAGRRSGNRTGTPNTSRRGSARISKPGNTGNSPHSIQRRRTTAVHHSRDPVTGQSMLGREPRSTNRFRSQPGALHDRPYSWHPGPQLAFSSQPDQTPMESFAGSTIEAFQNLAVTTTPPPIEQSIPNTFSAGHGFLSGISNPQYIPSSYMGITPMQQDLSAYGHGLQSWNQGSYNFPNSSAYAYADFQHPALMTSAVYPATEDSSLHNSQTHISQAADTVDDAAEELVGIGLYDDSPEKQPSSKFLPFELATARKSPTKELKLEETWQPPTNLNNDDESSEDGDDAQDLPNLSPDVIDVQPAFYPANLDLSNQDLSNQSFLFNEDNDPYVDDQYINLLAFNTGAEHSGQWKMHGPAAHCYTFF